MLHAEESHLVQIWDIVFERQSAPMMDQCWGVRVSSPCHNIFFLCLSLFLCYPYMLITPNFLLTHSMCRTCVLITVNKSLPLSFILGEPNQQILAGQNSRLEEDVNEMDFRYIGFCVLLDGQCKLLAGSKENRQKRKQS